MLEVDRQTFPRMGAFFHVDHAKDYLRHAYGDDEAERVVSLPYELQKSLYGDVLRFGPAAAMITEFSEKHKAVEAASKDSELSKSRAIAMRSMLVSLGKQVQRDKPYGQTETILASIAQWSNSNGHNILVGELIKLAQTPHVFSSKYIQNELPRQQGLYHVYSFLTGQYLFPESVIAVCAPRVENVNYILSSVGMHSLAGQFKTSRPE